MSFNQKKEKKCIIENIYETAFYYSVPFFVLCIGVTLLDFNERYGLLEYNKKRIYLYGELIIIILKYSNKKLSFYLLFSLYYNLNKCL